MTLEAALPRRYALLTSVPSSCVFIFTENQSLLADTEAGEDGGEDGGGGDGAGDGGEVVDGGAEVLGNEVAGEVGVEAVKDGLSGGGGRFEVFGVAQVGDDDGVFVGIAS